MTISQTSSASAATKPAANLPTGKIVLKRTIAARRSHPKSFPLACVSSRVGV